MTPAQLAARLETVKRLHERGETERAIQIVYDVANRLECQMYDAPTNGPIVTLSTEEYRHVR